MGKLTKQQEKQLAELEALRDAPDEEPDDDDGDDDEDQGVIVLRGRRADSFLDAIMGAGRKRTKPADKPAGDEDQGDEDQGDGADEDKGGEEETPPPAGHRFFR